MNQGSMQSIFLLSLEFTIYALNMVVGPKFEILDNSFLYLLNYSYIPSDKCWVISIPELGKKGTNPAVRLN